MNLYWFTYGDLGHWIVVLANTEEEAEKIVSEEDTCSSYELYGTTRLVGGKAGVIANIWSRECNFDIKDEPEMPN